MWPQVMHTRVGALTPHSAHVVLVISRAALFVSLRCGHSLALIVAILRSPRTQTEVYATRRIFIAVSVFFINIAIVNGPTPPGTGVR